MTSTIGDSPVTVTVSDSVAGLSAKLIVAVWSMSRATFGRVSVREPLQFGRDRVGAGRQRHEPELAASVGDLGPRQTGRVVLRRDGRARE